MRCACWPCTRDSRRSRSSGTRTRSDGWRWCAPSIPTLVVGDFNATLDQAPLRDLEDEGYRSVTELLNQGWQRTWPANGRYRPFNLFPVPRLVQIDQVMLGAGLAAIGSHTVHIDGTDHLGLVATFAAADEG